MGFDREHRLDSELNRLLDDLARPEGDSSIDIPGKRTRVEQLVDQLSAQERTRHRASGPGRRTLVERLVSMAGRLSFDDYRVTALRDVLATLGRKRKLHASTVAAADQGVARRATPPGRMPPGKADANGQAMWRAAERRAATLYRQAEGAGEVSPEDPAVEAALARAGSGAPLPAGVRRKMEDELGVSLARVRVHTDAVAAQAARAVRAEAFTVGEDIFFAEHAFAPESRAGQKLLAHELTHVVQGWHGRTGGGAGLRVSQPGESLEREADAVAERVGRGDRGDRAKPAGARPARPKPAPSASRAAGSRTLQRKIATDQRPNPGANNQGSVKPTLKRVVQRIPSATPSPAGAQADFKNKLGQAVDATKAHLAPLKTGINASKDTPVGAKSREHGKQEQKKTEDHKRAARAAEQQHHAASHAHKTAKHDGGPEGAPAPEKVDAHSPIQFKKVDNWGKYMPQAMPDQDERERARILALVKKKVEGERAESQKGLAQLHAAQVKQANAVRAMKPALQGQIASAQGAALGQVAGAEASQAAAVQASFAAAQAQVNAAASTAKGQINTAYAAAVAAINSAHQAAGQKLTQGQTEATTNIGTAEAAQIITVQAVYLGAHAQVDAAGAAEASHAAGLADSVPLPYDGDKLDAAKKAAHDTADGWAKEIPGKMQEEAQKNIYSHQGETEQGVHDIATKQKDQVKTVYDKLKETLETAHTQALTGASTARTQALAQIDSMAASTCASLAAQGAAQVAAVHQQASSARAGIIQAGQAAQASTAQACDQSAAGLEKGAIGLVKGAKEIEAPDPTATQAAVKQSAAQLQAAATSITGGLQKTASQAAQGLGTQAQGAAQGMAGIAAQAKMSAAQAAQGATQTINQSAQGATQALQKMGQDFTKQAQGISDGGDKAFSGIVKDIQTAYQTATKTLQDGIKTGVENLQKGFHSAIDDKEKAAIAENAKKAADAVKPWWQKALAFVLVIVVAIVITVVVTALTGGLGTGPLMIAMIGIGSGALAGGLSSAAGQIVNNLVMGKGAFDDFSWKEVGIGALAGGLTAGLASGVSAIGGATIKAAMEGATGLTNVAIRTGVNFTTGMAADAVAQLAINGKYEFSMQNMITTLGFSAVMSTNKFLDVQNRVGDGIRTSVGLDPIHVTTPSVDTGGAHPGEGGTGTHGTEPGSGPTGEPWGHGTEPGQGTKPGEGGPKPGDAPGRGTEPGQGTKPGEGGAKPGDTTGRGTEPGQGTKPGEGGPKPGEGGPKPGEGGPKPGEGKAPGEGGPKPGEGGPKPGEGKAPGEGGPKPGEGGPKPGEGKAPGEGGPKPGEDGKAPGEGGTKPGEDGKAPGEDGKAPGEDGKAPGEDGKKPGEDGKAPGEDGKDPGEDGKKPGEDGKKPGEDGKAPGEDGKPPGDKGTPEATSEEQQAHDTARDSEMNADGYPEATRAQADKAAASVDEGKPPTKNELRDTEANQRGREDLEKMLKDPNLSPEERVKIQKELAAKMRGEPDPTGNLDRDLGAAGDKVAADEAASGGGKEPPGDGPGKQPGEPEGSGPGKGKGGKVKTRGVAEDQLSAKGINDPVPLEPHERAAIEKYQAERNRYLERWREPDTSMPKETQDLLWGKADRAIRKNMTPDDLAAVVKEGRGVEIPKEDVTPFNHGEEYRGARNAAKNQMEKIKARLKALEEGGAAKPGEIDALQEKLGDLSKLLDSYERVGGLPASPEAPAGSTGGKDTPTGGPDTGAPTHPEPDAPGKTGGTDTDPSGTARGKELIDSGLSKEKVAEILAQEKGTRPDPKDYLPPEYVAEHLAKFEAEGASRFMTKSNLDKYGIGQRDGTSFIMPKSEADALLASANGNPRALEQALGLPEGFLDSNALVRIDIPKPGEHGLRVPSGNESGANDQWLPGGRLPTGNNEAIVDIKGMEAGKDYIATPLSLGGTP